ncbi:MAG: response regulator [Lentisphaerae bacterium]|nr:response regulator [Lentisphaerota bacterium]
MDEPAKAYILVVDDDRHLQVTLGDYLTFVGFDVDVAGTAEEALRKTAKRAPDLIILDISMPGMGGTGFLRKIRKRDGTCRYPVLVLTARAGMEEFFGSLSVDGFLAKPCAEAILERRVREILASKAVEAERAKYRSGTALVGENEPLAAARLKESLEEAGYHTEFAHSGPDLLHRASASAPDAIIMKEALPRMNGHVLVPLLRAMPRTAAIPVVVYEAAPSHGGASAGRACDEKDGATRSLASCDPEAILRALREIRS